MRSLWLVLTRLGFVVVYQMKPHPVVDAGVTAWPLDYLWSFGPRDVRALGFRKRLSLDVPTEVSLSTVDAGHDLHFVKRSDGDVDLMNGKRKGMRFCHWMLLKLRFRSLPVQTPVYVVFP